MKTTYKVTIIGGTDGFGKWLASYILEYFGKNISLIVTGKNLDKGRAMEKEFGEKLSFSNNNIGAIKYADIVIYSVPISLTEQIISETLPCIKIGAIVADVTSIKGFPSRVMQMRDDITVIPIHPMFGPYISSIAGQVFVLTPKKEVYNSSEYIFLKKHLESQKAKIIESTPEYHDKMMAVVQGLTHFNMFVIGETMKRLGFNIADSMDFISPIYKLMVSSVGRYLGQNPGLYADIQMYNDEVLEVHEKFLDTANNFHHSVKNKDYEKFCSDIISARSFLGVENCQEGQEYTDKLIYMIGAQIDILKNNIGKKISLKNIYSAQVISGILEKYENGEIFLNNNKVYKIDTHEILIA